MKKIHLNKHNSVIEFTLNSTDSQLLIHSIYLISKTNTGDQWTNFISKVKLTAELKYDYFDDVKGQLINHKKAQFQIHLLIDPYQALPVFHLNKVIKNESFTVGRNAERKIYNKLKLELHDTEQLDGDYTLAFNIEKSQIEE